MSSSEQAALGMGAAAAVLFLVAAVVLVRRLRFERRARRADGVVVDVVRDSGEFPVVTFDAVTSGGTSPVRFRSHVSVGSYVVGQTLPVLYDPVDPVNASILLSGRPIKMLAAAFFALALLLGSGALALQTWLVPLERGRDAALDRFFHAARRGDTLDGVIEDDALRAELAASEGFSTGSNVLDSKRACLRVSLEPKRTTVVLFVVREGKRWRVARAARQHACERDLD